MFLIRSIAQALPGRRDESVKVAREFLADMLAQTGGKNGRVLSASIGPSDSTVVMEMEHATLAEFEQGLERVNSWDKMATYGPKLAELTVPGSHRFEIYRIC